MLESLFNVTFSRMRTIKKKKKLGFINKSRTVLEGSLGNRLIYPSDF